MNAAIYCRISTDRDGRGLGVARQEADCRALCGQRDWEVAGVYIDNDISASSGKRRPEYERLLDDVKNGRVGAIVAYHNDRLLRSPRELEDFIDVVEMVGAEVATVIGGEYDLATGTGKMSARIVGAVARAESDRLKERIRRKHLELAQAGKDSGGGHRPFGFERDRVTIVEVEAELIREAAARVLAGGSVRGVCADWTEHGVLSSTGRPWTPHVIRRMLLAARIAGKREHKGLVTDAEWPAIVDVATWTRLRALLLDPGRRVNGNPRRYLLTGLAWCALCDTRLVARPRADKRRCYVCASGPGFHGCGKIRMLADWLEEHVEDRLFVALDDGTITANAPDDGSLDLALARVGEIELRLAELATDYYADKAISRSQFMAASQRLTGQLQAAQNLLAGFSRTSVPVPDNLRVTWKDQPFDVQRALLVRFVEWVHVGSAVWGRNRFDPDRVKIKWRE